MKYYFDTSALVKVYHPEDGTKEALECYLSDTPILISDLSRIEFLSTIHRKYREREISADALDALIVRFQEDLSDSYEVLEFSALVLRKERGRPLHLYIWLGILPISAPGKNHQNSSRSWRFN